VLAERAEEVELPTNSFDEIFFFHAIEHLHDPVGVMRNARDWLRADGRVRLWLPNFDSAERRMFGRAWNGLDVPRHLHHFSRDTITALLDACGFRVERIAPQFQGASLGASAQLALSRLGLGRKGPYRASGIVYSVAVPVGWLLSGLGNGAFIQVAARPAGMRSS
ncbi:MAG: class I SAM-dependent methyltransferase, partial [Solirubrobacterales bacterium]